jgi:AcrR family transcriptional regulator
MRADARRSHEAIVNAAGELFAARGSAVQMPEIAERAGVGMGTMYRHFATKQELLATIIARRFVAMVELAVAAERIADPWTAFETLLLSYLEAAEDDAAFRYAILGPEQTDWELIAAQKAQFSDVARRVLERAVDARCVRRDLTFEDFVAVTRGAMANMNPADDDWRRYLAITLEGIRTDRV